MALINVPTAILACNYTNIFDLDDDWGYSDRSIRHRVVVTGYGDLPANFKLAGTFTWNTGTPYSANLPFDANNDGEVNFDDLNMVLDAWGIAC